jgi:hypothetical protein
LLLLLLLLILHWQLLLLLAEQLLLVLLQRHHRPASGSRARFLDQATLLFFSRCRLRTFAQRLPPCWSADGLRALGM